MLHCMCQFHLNLNSEIDVQSVSLLLFAYVLRHAMQHPSTRILLITSTLTMMMYNDIA